jgi:hypothetical protein
MTADSLSQQTLPLKGLIMQTVLLSGAHDARHFKPSGLNILIYVSDIGKEIATLCHYIEKKGFVW